MSRTVESFAPADDRTVLMYTCGPTVYEPAHLGNFRTFLFEDLLRRVLRLRGWNVRQVMNLTDVDDKIIRRAHERGVKIDQITQPMAEIFQWDRAYLRILPADVYPRATEHIPEMIALIKALMERGVAYQAEDRSIYFAISRFPDYGKLSRLDTREIQAGARVAADDYNKQDVRDFALWKSAKDEDEQTGAAWDSPWGRGRPGWHLECSAMARKHLGNTLDIHCGAVDLIFPHHEDEIAQSEGATGVTFSRVWCHGEFLLTEGAKMAKRVGNVTSVQGLREAGIGAAAVRHFMFSTHYRKQLNLTEEALEASLASVRRVGEFEARLASAEAARAATNVESPKGSGLSEASERLRSEIREALFDDLNAPEALAALFTFIRAVNAGLDRAGIGSAVDAAGLAAAREAFDEANGILDILPDRSAAGEVDESSKLDSEFSAWVEERIAARLAARARRDFAAADAIRDELSGRGVLLKDTPTGTSWSTSRGGSGG
jgi:cysteinyl-tRNA synthetase